jgi:hypothetical protein
VGVVDGAAHTQKDDAFAFKPGNLTK